MTDPELLALATEFTLIHRRATSRQMDIGELKVCQRRYDPEAWAITDTSWVLNHDGMWELEPMPSNRIDDFLQRTRWPSAREAIAFAQAHMERYPTGTKPEPPPSDALDY